jgi:hypothetical protein
MKSSRAFFPVDLTHKARQDAEARLAVKSVVLIGIFLLLFNSFGS